MHEVVVLVQFSGRDVEAEIVFVVKVAGTVDVGGGREIELGERGMSYIKEKVIG